VRNLTIQRRKSFVACTGKLKVYIEDPAGDLTINGAPCRKLGEVKNGQTATFPIDENGGRLYAIFDKLSRDYCNDFYTVPAGAEDISVAGQCKFNPASGNAFRFDGSDNTEEGMAHHKRGNRKGLIFLIVALLIGGIFGKFVGGWIGGALVRDKDNAEPKTFTAEGMSITLNENFSKDAVDMFTACYSSGEAAVFALKEPFTLMDGLENYTLEQYGQLVLQTNGMTDFELQTVDGILYFEYEADNEADKTTYYYFSTLHKATDAFWLVQFACDTKDAEELNPSFIQWAKSVSFSA
jgi:hypothetical protein